MVGLSHSIFLHISLCDSIRTLLYRNPARWNGIPPTSLVFYRVKGSQCWFYIEYASCSWKQWFIWFPTCFQVETASWRQSIKWALRLGFVYDLSVWSSTRCNEIYSCVVMANCPIKRVLSFTRLAVFLISQITHTHTMQDPLLLSGNQVKNLTSSRLDILLYLKSLFLGHGHYFGLVPLSCPSLATLSSCFQIGISIGTLTRIQAGNEMEFAKALLKLMR